jgi:hypothetical protein
MKISDLVKFKIGGNGRDMFGFVMRVDAEHHGARQAFKIYKEVPRGHAVRPNMVDGIGPTKDGIQDRVLVLWCNDTGYEYVPENELEVISESG